MKYLILIILFIIGGTFIQPMEYVNSNSIIVNVLEQEKPQEKLVLPKSDSNKSVEVNLTDEIITLWEKGQIVETLPIAYQAKEGNWFQTTTGYFKVGEMEEVKRSSLTGVYMPYSIQFYEDFFIHEIPFLEDGTKLTSAYSGGCLRLETEHAKTLFEFAELEMPVIVFKTFEGLVLKEGYHSPVDFSKAWIRQRFNNPIRETYNYGGDIDNIHLDYVQHTGVDFSVNGKEKVFSIDDGIVSGIWENGESDRGLGNTIIIYHEDFYVLYGHLDSLEEIEIGDEVSRGDVLGVVGNTGRGCNYWRIGKDGCDSKNPPDTHLHLEIKSKSVLGSPKSNNRYCGYTPNHPTNYGYQDPLKILFN